MRYAANPDKIDPLQLAIDFLSCGDHEAAIEVLTDREVPEAEAKALIEALGDAMDAIAIRLA